MKVDVTNPKRDTWMKGYGRGRVERRGTGGGEGMGGEGRSRAAMSKGEETNTHMCSRCCLP